MFVYLHGFASGPSSFKAQLFRRDLALLGIDLQVPALDQGDFTHLTLSRQLAVVEALCSGPGRDPLVIIGSSMGGYLAALYAARHPVAALVLMAPAVDFARRWRERLGPQEMAAWQAQGFTEVDHHATRRRERLAYDLMADAERHEAWPRTSCPALVLQGTRDEVVPQPLVERWVAQNPGARLVLLDAGHELIECADALLAETRRFLTGLGLVAP